MKVDGVEIDYSGLPAEHRETVRRYLEGGIYPGTGWATILARDLFAVRACDRDTVRQLPEIVLWLHNHAPLNSWGSAEVVRNWMIRRRREAA